MRMDIGKRNDELYGSNNEYLGQSRNLKIGSILRINMPSNNSKKTHCRFSKDNGLLILRNVD